MNDEALSRMTSTRMKMKLPHILPLTPIKDILWEDRQWLNLIHLFNGSSNSKVLSRVDDGTLLFVINWESAGAWLSRVCECGWNLHYKWHLTHPTGTDAGRKFDSFANNTDTRTLPKKWKDFNHFIPVVMCNFPVHSKRKIQLFLFYF